MKEEGGLGQGGAEGGGGGGGGPRGSAGSPEPDSPPHSLPDGGWCLPTRQSGTISSALAKRRLLVKAAAPPVSGRKRANGIQK